MSDEVPLMDVLTSMTWSSFKACDLSPRELMIARLSALAAVGAPPVSYLVNTGVARDAGIALEDVESVLIAVAPIIGTALTVTASGNIARSLGFEVSATESGLEAGVRSEDS